jgi:urease accessory protein
MSTESLLALLQIADSAFPSGGFAHSYGLEQAWRDGLVADVVGLEAFVTSVVRQSVATSEARAAFAAATAARDGNVERIVAADRALLRTKAASELRAASLQTGRRLVEEASVHVEAPVLRRYANEIAGDATLGCHAIAFGVVGAALGAEPDEVPAALMLAAANALLQAAMRLGRVSHRDAQGVLHRLRPLIAELNEGVVAAGPSGRLRAFHPAQEIASMRHARAEARLFAS